MNFQNRKIEANVINFFRISCIGLRIYDVANSLNKLNLLHKLTQICQSQPYHTITQQINFQMTTSMQQVMMFTSNQILVLFNPLRIESDTFHGVSKDAHNINPLEYESVAWDAYVLSQFFLRNTIQIVSICCQSIFVRD